MAGVREAVQEAEIRRRGMPAARLRLYTSEESDSSVEKAGIVLGVGQDNVVKVRTDSAFRMDPSELRNAIERDRRDGHLPFAVVATVGTTSVTAVDPVPEIAAICRAEGLWLHVDAAYGGAAAVLDSHPRVLARREHAVSPVLHPPNMRLPPVGWRLPHCLAR